MLWERVGRFMYESGAYQLRAQLTTDKQYVLAWRLFAQDEYIDSFETVALGKSGAEQIEGLEAA